MPSFLGQNYGEGDNIAESIYEIIKDKLQQIFEDEISEDIIKIIMILTSDKYDGDREGARNDLLDVLEFEDKVEELLQWLEKELPKKLSDLKQAESKKKTNKPASNSGKKDDDKNTKGKSSTQNYNAKPAPRKSSNEYKSQKKPVNNKSGYNDKLGKRSRPDNNENEDDSKKQSILDRIKPKKGGQENKKTDSPMKASANRKVIKTSDKTNPYAPITVQSKGNNVEYKKKEDYSYKKKEDYKPKTNNTNPITNGNDENNINNTTNNEDGVNNEEDKWAGKIRKRCNFWPNCKNEDCQYIHPSENCPKFPKCSFGDQCFYIHPTIPCKYGVYCQRPNCSYVHPTGWPGHQQCMYYPGSFGGANPFASGPYAQQHY